MGHVVVAIETAAGARLKFSKSSKSPDQADGCVVPLATIIDFWFLYHKTVKAVIVFRKNARWRIKHNGSDCF